MPAGLLLDLRRMVERGVLWLLRHRRPPLDIGATVAAFRDRRRRASPRPSPDVIGPGLRRRHGRGTERDIDAGVPAELAARAAAWPYLHTAFDVVEVAGRPGPHADDARASTGACSIGSTWAGCGTASGRCPATTAGRATPGRRCATTCWASCAHLADDALRAGDVFTPSAEWSTVGGGQRAGVGAVDAVFAEIRAGGVFDLTTLSVALRQLRNLVLASGPC